MLSPRIMMCLSTVSTFSLSPLKEAVQTCLLSKTWRYLGSTCPKIDLCGICDKCLARRRLGESNNFCENCFGGNQETFLFVLDKTLQRSQSSSRHIWLQIHLIFVLVISMGMRSTLIYLLRKIFISNPWRNYTCSDAGSTKLILLISPLLENVTLEWCECLRTVKFTNKHPNYLKHLCIHFCNGVDDSQKTVEMDAPALETIEVFSCRKWYLHNKYLLNLKFLRLSGVNLSSEFFENFSSKFPCLEELYICNCNMHLHEFHLSSRSIKHLTISGSEEVTKVTIDAPNILYFKISGQFPPSKLSFTKISSECESLVDMWFAEDDGYDVLPWFVNLYEMIRALGQSQITVQTCHDRLPHHESIGGFNEPVLVENLSLRLAAYYDYSSPSLREI